MTSEYNQLFDSFRETAFRLETLQRYDVDEESERIRAFRKGAPRPEQSVRTSEWLARMAVTTVRDGKRWHRVHVVEHPLSEYLRYELIGYAESAVCGEEIRIADREADPGLVELDQDFWLFDAEMDEAVVALMDYGPQGEFLGAEVTDEPTVLDRCRAQRNLALEHSVPLNIYLARMGGEESTP